jgi:hypothetical protein
MKMAKSSPATSGVLVPNNQSPSTAYIPAVTTTTVRPVTTSYVTPYYFHRAPASVIIQSHSQPRDNYIPPTKNIHILDQPTISIPSNDISRIAPPSVYYEPPLEPSRTLLNPIVVLPSSTPAPDESDLPPIAYHGPTSTPAPSTFKDESHLPPLAYYPSSTVRPLIKDESDLPPLALTDDNSVIPLSSTLSPIIVSPLSNDLLPPKSSSDNVVTITSRPRTNYRHSAYRHGSSSAERNVIVENSIDNRQKYQNYDGVGTTQNGFRYFLPRHYQEEATNNDETRDGSYGYIDPFGIRRVVYYNAGKNGFVHRKNNRFVGFNSTPYDPRPN